MAQTHAGAMKGLAAKAGVSLIELQARVASGEKWCMNCREFHLRSAFGSDASRYDGLTPGCSASRVYVRSTSGPGMHERKAHAALGLFWCRGCERWHGPEMVRAGLCKPSIRAEARRRYVEDPDYRSRRKAHAHRRKRGVEPMPVDGAEILFETFEGRCAYCLEPATTWDHVLAVSRGGLTVPGNMLPACLSCNSSKRAKPLEQWLQEVAHLPAITIEMLTLWGKLY